MSPGALAEGLHGLRRKSPGRFATGNASWRIALNIQQRVGGSEDQLVAETQATTQETAVDCRQFVRRAIISLAH